MQYEFLYEGNPYTVDIEQKGELFRITVGGRAYEVQAESMAPGLLSMILDGRSVLAHTARDERGRIVCIHGVPYHLGDLTDDEGAAGAAGGQAGDGVITTPMPGKIVAVHVKEGDAVEKGQPLIVVEAMKMQNDLLSDVKGVVKKVHFGEGDQAAFGEPLIEIEVESED
jgi:biotin carboxyl carrier protein